MEKQFKVRTKFGITYQLITSWEKWEFSENYVQFKYGVNNKLLILHIFDIESIEEV